MMQLNFLRFRRRRRHHHRLQHGLLDLFHVVVLYRRRRHHHLLLPNHEHIFSPNLSPYELYRKLHSFLLFQMFPHYLGLHKH